MRIENDVKLDFDDVLIVPQRSSLSSRSEVDLNRTYKFPHCKRTWTGIGIMASNFDTVGTFEMAKVFGKQNMLVALHKFYPVDELVNFFVENLNLWDNVFYTIGANTKDWDKLLEVREKIAERIVKKYSVKQVENLSFFLGGNCQDMFPRMLCLDVANGYQEFFSDWVIKSRKEYPNSIIMAGNVVTGNMTEELILNGADICKIGLGSGSVCVTRVKAGVGFPQLSAIDGCAYQAHGLRGHICSDGGITSPGAAAKAFSCGADFIMLGGILAGTDECSGEWIEEDGKKLLRFYGMSSKEAQEKYNGGLSDYKSSEGKCVTVPYKGPVLDILNDITGGIRSCCSYVGCSQIKDLPKCASFIKVNKTHNTVFGQ